MAGAARLRLARVLVLSDASGDEIAAAPAPPTPEARFLAGMWADILGVEGVPVDANYWQRFSFLEAVARARDAGVRLDDAQVARNRTIVGLATDLAAERERARARHRSRD